MQEARPVRARPGRLQPAGQSTFVQYIAWDLGDTLSHSIDDRSKRPVLYLFFFALLPPRPKERQLSIIHLE